LSANRLAYLLLLLLISAQVDDVWAATPASPSAPLADDDEYLPAQQRPEEEQIALGQGLPFVGLRAPPADLPVAQKRPPSGPNPATPFTPQPLYAFMSLRL
jgi:hypothetical protein